MTHQSQSLVIGKTGKNISKEDSLDYIAGYVTSNDVSARTWQRDPAYAGVVPQWCFSKGFDKYAPLGPVLVSPKVTCLVTIGLPKDLLYVRADFGGG